MTKLVAVAICSSFLVAAAISIGATSKYWMKEKVQENKEGEVREKIRCVELAESRENVGGEPNSNGNCSSK